MSGGTVLANIEATGTDDTDFTNVAEPIPGQPDLIHHNFAAEYIRAGRGITGNLAAVGGFLDDYTDPNAPIWRQSSIRRVIVGPADSPTGIQGDITAHNGKIGVIQTTGPIGSVAASRPVLIRACTGIDEVRAVDYLNADGEVAYARRAKDINFRADIDASFNFPRTGLRLLGEPASDSPLRLIQTEGSFTGSIHAANIAPAYRYPLTAPSRPIHSGILIRGVMRAPINIDYLVKDCDILARGFPQPIVIGVGCQGDLVAHGRDDQITQRETPPWTTSRGYIASLTVGHTTIPVPQTGETVYYYEHPRGILGRAGSSGFYPGPWYGCEPGACCQPNTPLEYRFPLSSWLNGFTPDAWLYNLLDTNITPTGGYGGSMDTLVRADTIDLLRVKSIRADDGKKYPPRVEALVINDLRVGDVREGAIWSGNYEFIPQTPFTSGCGGVTLAPWKGGNPEIAQVVRDCDYDASNDFTTLGLVDIGCVGHDGHVWFQHCPRFVIQNSCLGGLHLPVLETGEIIWIGDRLGALGPNGATTADFCECITSDPPRVAIGTGTACTPDRCGLSTLVCGLGANDFTHDVMSYVPRHSYRLTRGLITIGDWLGAVDSAGAPLHTGDRAIRGQIILNGKNHPLVRDVGGTLVPDYRWEGKVTTGPSLPRILPDGISTGTCHSNDITPLPQVAIKPVDSDPGTGTEWDTTAPYYATLPRSLGSVNPAAPVAAGGSIGVAPFHLHEAACEPPHNFAVPTADRADATITHSSFFQLGTQIKIRSYGPIRTRKLATGMRREWQSSVRIDALSETPGQECVATDMTFMFTVRGPGDSGWTEDDRTITLSAGQYLSPRPGIYRVVPLHVVCFDVFGEPDVAWAQECDTVFNGSYKFRIAPDCDRNLVNDYKDILLDSTLDTNPMDGNIDSCVLSQSEKCRADFNRSGSVTVQDVFDFLSNWFILCPGPSTQLGQPCFGTADFNHSGTITVQDIFDFLNTWFESGGTNCQ